MVSARIPATVSTSTLSGLVRWIDRDGVGDDESVDLALRDALERGAVEETVRRARVDRQRSCLLERGGARDQRPGRVDDVVRHHDDLLLDLADDGGDACDLLLGPLLVQDDEVAADHLGELAGELRAPRVRRDRGDRLLEVEVAHVLGEERDRRHVVDGDVEEALYLAGMEIHREHAIRARRLQHVGDEAGRDRLARPRLLVLPRVEVPRDDRRDPLRGGEPRRVDHDQELHEVPVDRIARRLDDEHVRTPDRLLVPAVGLAVRERLELDVPELDVRAARRSAAPGRGSSDPRTASVASGARSRSRGPTSSSG